MDNKKYAWMEWISKTWIAGIKRIRRKKSTLRGKKWITKRQSGFRRGRMDLEEEEWI